ncbi:DNA polymerase III subunit gamma/tau [Synechococcus sp. Cruz CV12-2-Slac-r]|uniref:DNA polymerase III subunit gamma/tau n=1 Tax=Synechococcus sp. Cruz CV12-2-Slac-r TaxID=2823748 RepID=UPI0020CE3DF0|nr:DNA polymerase III subunit gamma/tau [Synechococcus sp. Cruz CV12-2-Slac-r]MCP9940029.1 DNA polymerase III subunit gamma/tau [Synechococcus sp. Cruz CV12-2-Slac-r]
MAYEPLHHKYRPQRFSQLVGQEAIATTLSNALRTGRIAPAYLFTGPRGTGKTSSARILARSLNCVASSEPTPEPCGSCELCRSIASGSALDVIEIDAASNTGVDNIRDLIERSRFAPVQARWKVYVVDECHMLSTAAFNALLKTLEEPPPRVVFVLATTDPQRVLPTILSRCQRFDFRRIPLEAMEQHLSWIAKQEAIAINPAAIHLVAQMAQGGLRDAESLLDQLSLLPPPVEPDAVWELLGAVPEQELLGLAAALAAADPVALLKNIRGLLDRGREATAVLQGIAGLLRDLVLAIAAPDQPELSGFSPANRAELPALANRLGRQKLLSWQQGLRGSETQLRQSAQPRLWLEVLLLGLLSEPANASAPVVTKAIHTQVETGVKTIAKSEAPQKAPVVNNEIINNEIVNNEITNNKSQDLAVIWQQILASLELPSTRMLLSQQGELVRLDRSKAIVRVAPNWVAMVQSRLPLLEQATTKALGETRQVIIETGSAQVLDAHISKEITKPAISIPTPKPISTPAAPVSIQKTEAISQTIQSNGIEVEAKRLAEFFNGEVVLDSDDLE